MLHFFNPGHEEAVANSSRNYQPPRQVAKLQNDLATLPLWYAEAGEEVLVKSEERRVKSEKWGEGEFENRVVEFWGLSPAAINYVEKLNERYGLDIVVPEWKDEYRYLSSRYAARDVLARLIDVCPEIDKKLLPTFVNNINEIETLLGLNSFPQSFIVKSPYSSSGRGLVWLPEGKMERSEKQIISGMLRRQGSVSIERAVDKTLDFSMHFKTISSGKVDFLGYSVFATNARGAYESSRIAAQSELEKQISQHIDRQLLDKIRLRLSEAISDLYSPVYKGNIGVDMMVWRDGDRLRLHPCVEINMRKSMGYLAIRLMEAYLHPEAQGRLTVDFHKNHADLMVEHIEMQKKHPLQMLEGRIRSGYLSLCPIDVDTCYRAYVSVN